MNFFRHFHNDVPVAEDMYRTRELGPVFPRCPRCNVEMAETRWYRDKDRDGGHVVRHFSCARCGTLAIFDVPEEK